MTEQRRTTRERRGAVTPANAEHLAGMLKALAHPVRLLIVATLCDGARHVSELAERLGRPPAAVSQQLAILRMHGLVTVIRQGGFARYRIAIPRLRQLVQCLGGCPTSR